MATIIGKAAGKVTTAIVKAQTKNSKITQGPINKLWRLKILENRANSPMQKMPAPTPVLGVGVTASERQADAYNLHYTHTNSQAQLKDKWTHDKIMHKATGRDPDDRADYGIDHTKGKKQTSTAINNEIIIVNRNSVPAISLVLQNRPDTLSIDPTGSWASVRSPGRNNPFYIYSGGEDTITLDISWYAVDPVYRDDVLNKCKLLHSWSKANGYNASPPTLEIIWGNSGIFNNDKFILFSAPYQLKNFQNAHRGTPTDDNPSGHVDLRLLPNCATQTLTFKKVTTDNTNHEDIIAHSDLVRTPGIISPVNE